MTPANERESATLGGGCFWCLEAVYQDLQGVEKVLPGYAGGSVADPSYRQVCTGSTGHAEVVQVTYDPKRISYSEILKIFFSIHDPTTLNRQGPDVGTQYRSVIFYHSEAQKEIAHRIIDEIEREEIWDAPVVTDVKPLQEFYPAEAYHRRYFENNPQQAYCQAVISPKVRKFRRQFAGKLKE